MFGWVWMGFFWCSFVLDKMPKTYYQTMAEGNETLSVLEWVFPFCCFLVIVWNQHFLSITFVENKQLCCWKPVLHNMLWLCFMLKNFESTLEHNTITIKITHKMFDVWEAFVLLLVLRQLKSSEFLSREADERKEGNFSLPQGLGSYL